MYGIIQYIIRVLKNCVVLFDIYSCIWYLEMHKAVCIDTAAISIFPDV